MQFQIAPSILSADFLNLGRDIEALNNASVDFIHLDIMDGSFVPNISFGFSVIDDLVKVARVPIDAHLMIVHPEKFFERFAKLGTKMLSFHLEAALADGNDPSKLLGQIKSLGMKAGLAFNPDVPVEECFQYIKDADFIVLMSVYAGFGGQKIIKEAPERIKSLKTEILHLKSDCLIEIDGGVTDKNIAELVACGADIVVSGSAVFKTDDPESEINTLREIVNRTRF